MNPLCPNCGNLLRLKAMSYETREGMRGRSKFWVCERCRRSPLAKIGDLKWRWRVGEEVIRRMRHQ